MDRQDAIEFDGLMRIGESTGEQNAKIAQAPGPDHRSRYREARWKRSQRVSRICSRILDKFAQGEIDWNRFARRYSGFVDRRVHLTNSGIDMDLPIFLGRPFIT